MLSKYKEKYVICMERHVYYVNEIGARIYELCNGKNSLENIITIIAKKFNIPEKEIQEDIKIYIDMLVELDLIRCI